MSTMFKIFIGNLNFKTTEEQLRAVFEPHIVIEDLVIARDEKTGQSRGFGFVMTRDPEKARIALRRIGKVMMDNRLVYFKEAHGKKIGYKPRPTHRPQRSGPRGNMRRPGPGGPPPRRDAGPGAPRTTHSPKPPLDPTIIRENLGGYSNPGADAAQPPRRSED
ncbi:MAG: hypothetical protein GC162_08850 [Planctomycetes bacterium]|nr:hypothetical protein [Planctomycetota bacterium]